MSWTGVLTLCNFALLLSLFLVGIPLLYRARRRMQRRDRRGRA